MGIALDMQLVTLAGFAIGVLIVLAVSYWGVRKHRPHLSGDAFKQLYLQNLTRVGAWSVASYALWFIVVSPLLAMHGVHIPRPAK